MILSCNKCILGKKNICLSGEGSITSPIMLVGQSLGYEELKSKHIFAGMAGVILNSLLSSTGLKRDELYITNIVKGFVKPGTTVNKNSIRICSNEHLVKEVEEVKPKVIVCLGSVAAKFFGRTFVVNSEFYSDKYNCHVIITRHPATLLYNNNNHARGQIIKALIRAKELCKTRPMESTVPTTIIIKDADQLIQYKDKLQQEVAVDLETTGLNFLVDNIITVGIYDGIYKLGIKFSKDSKDLIKEILTSRRIIGHNFKFDYKFLKKEGINLEQNVYFDTRLAHYLLDRESPTSLEALTIKYIHSKLTKGTIDFDSIDIQAIDYDKFCDYVANDAYATYEIYKKIKKEINSKFSIIFYKVMVPTAVWLAEAEFHGVKIDREYVTKTINSFKYKLKSIEHSINNDPVIQQYLKSKNLERFNFRSPKQISDVLYSQLKLESKEKNTSEQTLTNLLEKYPNTAILNNIIQYRKIYKCYRTYLTNFISLSEIDGKIHCTYDQCRTATGRLASRNPNMQNIPKGGELSSQIRRSFIAHEGYSFMEADYKQMEFRCLAHYSQDPKMIYLINNGEDIHRIIASLAYSKKAKDITDEERRIAKSIVFGLMYGRGEKSIAEQFNISFEEAKHIKDTFFNTFSKAKVWIENVQKFAFKYKCVKNLFGRVITLPQLYSKDHEKVTYGLRCAVNYPIQSTAADITNFGSALLFKEFRNAKLDAKIVMNIHDAIIIEFHDSVKDIVEDLVLKTLVDKVQDEIKFRVKLSVDKKIGKNLDFIEK